MEIGKIDLSKIKLKRPKLGWGWKYIDASIVVMGIAIAVLVWFVPSLDQNKDMQAFIKRQKDAREYHQRVEAEKARIKKEEEELGLVWIPPPAAPAAPSVKPTPGKAPAKPTVAKPAPAKKPN
ncbi:MAG TPA: hypothetical protein VGO52_24330 [Hyphomonadaceae bacterium]|nr:hypothetical protein [Hyphomonadaceae bacterium]